MTSDKLQPVRILAGPSGFPLSGGRSGRRNEVLDAGSRIPSRDRGAFSAPDSRLFRAAGGGGFWKSLGRTGSDPVDTCPGRTAARLEFDSWGGGLRTFPALRFPRQRLEAPPSSPLPLRTTPPLFKAKLSAALFLFGPAPTLWRFKVKPDALRRALEEEAQPR
jgi:hypothetical protein